jgi:SulP family sulfate permease
VLIDMTANDELDLTSVEMLENLAEQLHNEAIELLLAEVHEPVKEMVERSGLLKKIGTEQIFPTVDAAVQHFRT